MQNSPKAKRLVIQPVNPKIEQLGDKGAVVLRFDSVVLQKRHDDMIALGGSHDYDAYRPHVTITYRAGPEVLILAKEGLITPYTGDLIFGPEEYRAFLEDYVPAEK